MTPYTPRQRRALLVLAVLGALAAGVEVALADEIPNEGFDVCRLGNLPCLLGAPTMRRPTGDADLDRAIVLCDQHARASGRIYATNPPSDVPAWSTGWEMCSAVLAKWTASDAARQQREWEAQETLDREFVKKFVEGK